ncbi:MAG: hypothetical protein GY925_12885 [Actinomycetia bacterium]|nr:hypothetical protein [Actinomycetes bacterium]
MTDVVTYLAVLVAVGAVSAWILDIVRARQHRAQIDAISRAHQAQVDALTARVAAAELGAAIARPPSPIVARLAHQGPASLGTLTGEYGYSVAVYLGRLIEAQEVRCRPDGMFEAILASERLGYLRGGPCDTIRVVGWIETNGARRFAHPVTKLQPPPSHDTMIL